MTAAAVVAGISDAEQTDCFCYTNNSYWHMIHWPALAANSAEKPRENDLCDARARSAVQAPGPAAPGLEWRRGRRLVSLPPQACVYAVFTVV